MLIGLMVFAILLVLAVVIIYQVYLAQNITGWSTLDTTLIALVPSVLLIIGIIAMFLGLQKAQGV